MWEAESWDTKEEVSVDEWYIDNYETLDADDLEAIDDCNDISILKNEWVIIQLGEDDPWCYGSMDKSQVERQMTELVSDGIAGNITVYHFGKDINWKVSIEG